VPIFFVDRDFSQQATTKRESRPFHAIGEIVHVDSARPCGDGGGLSDRIENIKNAIERGHDCRASHIRSATVREMFGDKVVWGGIVEVFAITGHPQAKYAYSWSFENQGLPQYVTVLQIPPVWTPQTAVRTAIASGQQK
jgi:hypothetical protein